MVVVFGVLMTGEEVGKFHYTVLPKNCTDYLRKIITHSQKKVVCCRVTPEADIVKSHPRLIQMVCLSMISQLFRFIRTFHILAHTHSYCSE
jgi:hypothetical protein